MKRILCAMTLAFACMAIANVIGARAQAPPAQPAPQTPPAPQGQPAPQPPPAQAGAASTVATPPAPPPAPSSAPPTARASWISDRAPLRVGDVLMVVIDEQTSAREYASRTASADRSTQAGLRARAQGKDAIGATEVTAGLQGDSRDIGETNREGDLVATLSVRVTAIDNVGNAQIEGRKKVTVDGRDQEIALTGTVRPEDIPPSNIIHSSRIADASFGYTGKKIGPRRSILGRILSILWP